MEKTEMNPVYRMFVDLIYQVWKKSHSTVQDEENWQYALNHGHFDDALALTSDFLLFLSAITVLIIWNFKDISRRRFRHG